MRPRALVRPISGLLLMNRSRVLFLSLAAALTIAAAPEQPPLVAVIDSGVARTAELGPALVAEYDTASAQPRAPFEPRFDHGTMVAMILLRAAAGHVRIVSMRIDDPAGCPANANPPCQPSPQPVARAIRQATALGVQAINLSLALQDDPAIVAAVHDAAAKGITVVMAAGNDGLNHPGNLSMARAGFPHAVLVGALDTGGKPWTGTNRPSDESRPGYLYAWQQGVDVPTARLTGAAVTGTGTSFAAPIETARLVMKTVTAVTAPPTRSGPDETAGASISS